MIEKAPYNEERNASRGRLKKDEELFVWHRGRAGDILAQRSRADTVSLGAEDGTRIGGQRSITLHWSKNTNTQAIFTRPGSLSTVAISYPNVR